jgi:hypothetical protein
MWLPQVSLGVEWFNIPVLRPLRQRYRRPRFTVGSLMIVVAIAGLILSLVAYEQRLRGWAIYHEAKYFEHITPVSPQARASGLMYRSKLLDGTWSVMHYKTPQAEWHEQMKWGYQRAIIHTNFLLATLVGSVFLCLFGKVVLTKFHRVRGGSQ